MSYRLFITLSVCLCYITSFAQKRVFVPFTVPVFVDQFDQPDDTWPIIKNTEMYAGYDNGDYFLFRNNPVSPYVLMAKWPNTIEKFHLKAGFKLGPQISTIPYIGIVVMASDDGENGVLIEINRDKEYRIRRIENGKFVLLTKKEWTKSSGLKRRNNKNEIEIKTDNGEYDLYFNGKYETSFSVHELFMGNFGIVIGPDTKAKAIHYNVVSVRNSEGNTSIMGTNYAALLKTTLEENNNLKKLIQEQKNRIIDLSDVNPTKIAMLESAINVLENELLSRQKDILNLRANNQNQKLQLDSVLANCLEDSMKQVVITPKDSEVLTSEYLQKIEFLSDALGRSEEKLDQLREDNKRAISRYNQLEKEFNSYQEKVLKQLGLNTKSKRKSKN